MQHMIVVSDAWHEICKIQLEYKNSLAGINDIKKQDICVLGRVGR